jgi:hypothetical protein
MNLQQRIESFAKLGNILSNLSDLAFNELALNAINSNTWFTHENVRSSINGICKFLSKDALIAWSGRYNLPEELHTAKTVGVVMAGNIPLVGFHDLLCVLISGHRLKIKLSSQDAPLLQFVCNTLAEINPYFLENITIAEQLKEVDAIIATGSDNTSRYFEYYFAKYPNIIRKNRTSFAIFTGDETPEDFKALGLDIFSYFGLGCRNVAKLYVPRDYNFDIFFQSIEQYSTVAQHHKYNNNYDYNKSIYLVNRVQHLDNGFLLLRESNELVSPISVLYYEQYDNQKMLKARLAKNSEKIQCIVSKNGRWENSFSFGSAQSPSIGDYADNVDTMKFLVGL